jgi:serine/threonine-protein kinase
VAVETHILPTRYRDAERIGRGGMGEIYRATDTTLGRPVAVKILAQQYAEDASVRSRFRREALAAARLSGESNAVTIFDVGEWQGRPYIVMEYLGGGSLEEKLRDHGAVSVEQALEWLEQAARALDTAHAHGVVHRDVKPANLLLDQNDDVHVADFGIASAAGLDSLTMTGTVLGTAGYLSPEQAQGNRATSASDRYSLAVVAFELLTGARPFERDSITAEAAAHVHSAVPSVRDLSDLPVELDPVFQRALAKDPRQRYPGCVEFVADLRAAFREAATPTRRLQPWPTLTPPPTATTAPVRAAPRPVPARPSRAPWQILLALLALLVLGGGVAAAILLTRGGGHTPAPVTVVRTVVKTQQGTTVLQTTTVQQTTTAQQSTTAATTAPAPSGNPHDLNDRGYALMQAGDFQAALPLLQQAVQGLQGAGPSDPYEGYANYNLGYTLLQLNHCAEALGYLQRADQLEPGNHDVHRAIVRAKHC